MKTKLYLILFSITASPSLFAQTVKAYTTAQAHSHNDYTRARPFYEAYGQQFGSIEADLHLVNDTLIVAHEAREIKPGNTFSVLYLKPLLEQIEKNNGKIYPHDDLPLQLLIDLKTAAEPTLAALVNILEPHQHIFAPKGSIRIVISGNVPDPARFGDYPAYIYFDGRPDNTYSPEQLERVGLISQAFQRYSRWNGEGELPEKDKKNIMKMVNRVHDLNKKVRLWATPDNINSWKTMMSIGVDYLNTDKVRELGDYLRTAPR